MCHRGLKCVCVFGLSQNCVSLWEEHALQAFWSKRDKRPMEQTWTQIADWSWAQPWSAKSSPYADMWARINDWISFKTFYFELLLNFSSVQSLSRVWLFVTSWITARQAFLSITNSWSLPKLMSIESMMPSSHLTLCHPLLLLPPIPPSIRVFSNESTLRMRWPKYWSFSFSISPFNEHPGLISFRMDWLDLLAVQGTLKSLLQHHSSKASILWRSAFFTVQLSHPYMTTGKTYTELIRIIQRVSIHHSHDFSQC